MQEFDKGKFSTGKFSADEFSGQQVFLEIPQNSQESTCAKVYFLTKFIMPDTGVFL